MEITQQQQFLKTSTWKCVLREYPTEAGSSHELPNSVCFKVKATGVLTIFKAPSPGQGCEQRVQEMETPFVYLPSVRGKHKSNSMLDLFLLL